MNPTIRYAALAAGLWLSGSQANAAAEQPADLSLATQPVTTTASQPQRDLRAMGLAFFWENDGNFVKPNNSTDQDYSAGLGIAIQWQCRQADAFIGSLPSIGNEFALGAKDVSFGGGVEVSLNIYTPEDLSDPLPIDDEHPYAGWSYLGLVAQRANRAGSVATFEHHELDLATIGPTGQAGKVQRWLHKSCGYEVPKGWDNQIRDEFGADYRYQRRWRINLAGDNRGQGAGVQLIPEGGFTLGTMHINASGGATLRAGWNLPNDFGPARLRYISDFTRPFKEERPNWGVYAFVRATGIIVGHDSTISGSYFQDSPVELNSQVFTAELQGGVAVQFFRHCELSYSQTLTSPQFIGQNYFDSYGALNLTLVYAW